MNVRTKGNKYFVAFSQGGKDIFLKGPNTGGIRVITTCEIFLLTTASGSTLLGRGTAELGSEDVPDSLVGCRFAFDRAIKDAGFYRETRTAFWAEFNKRHRRHRFHHVGGTLPKKLIDSAQALMSELETTPGYGGLHSWQRRALQQTESLRRKSVRRLARKMVAVSTPHGHGPAKFAERLRHEYGNEVIVPVPKRVGAEKREQLRQAYSPWRQQAEDRCHRVGKEAAAKMFLPRITITNTVGTDQLKTALAGDGAKRILEMLAEGKQQKLRRYVDGDWQTEHQVFVDAERTNAELATRPGVTRHGDTFIIDTDVFTPAFRVGQVVRYLGEPVRIRDIHGPVVTVQPLVGGNRAAMDWELELLVQPGILRRAWTWLTTYRADTFPGDESLEKVTPRAVSCGPGIIWRHSEDKDTAEKYCSCGKLGCVCGD